MASIILLIISCEKYRHKTMIQKNTWLKNLPPSISYYHVIGNPAKCNGSDYVIDAHHQIIYTNTKDDYLSLPHKVITAIQAVESTFYYDYLYKTDDDQTLSNPHFFSWLCDTLSSHQYGGYAVDIETHQSDYWTVHSELPKDVVLEKTTYCTGRFYFLSKKAAQGLLLHKAEISTRIIEDHTMGYFLPSEFKQPILRMNDMIKVSFVDFE